RQALLRAASSSPTQLAGRITRLRVSEEQRAMPAYEKPPAWRADDYFVRGAGKGAARVLTKNKKMRIV
ncbi:MAG: hypothetical protein IJM21_07165, partial [Clostridia bacterium]|nr:hypothetical protein [Clostridia bacterium]